MKLLGLKMLVLYCLFCASTQGSTLNFDPTTYNLGPINGQDGWTGQSNVWVSNRDVVMGIPDVLAHSGDQFVSFPVTSNYDSCIRTLDTSYSVGKVTVDIAMWYNTDKSGYVDLVDSTDKTLVSFGISKGTYSGGNGNHWAFDYGPAGHVGAAAPTGTFRWLEIRAIIDLTANTADLFWREKGGSVFTSVLSSYAIQPLSAGASLSKVRLGTYKNTSRFDSLSVVAGVPTIGEDTDVYFDPPTYNLGSINSQDSWTGQNNILVSNRDVVMGIPDVLAHSGDQFVSFPVTSNYDSCVRTLNNGYVSGKVLVDIAMWYNTDKSGYVNLMDSAGKTLVGFGIGKGTYGGNSGTHWGFDYGPAGHVGVAAPVGTFRWLEIRSIIDLDTNKADLLWREKGSLSYTTVLSNYSIQSLSTGATLSKVVLGTYKNTSRFDSLSVHLPDLPTCQELLSNGYRLTGDLNNDCYVNIEDIAFFIGEWLHCNDPLNSSCSDNWQW